MHGVFFDMKEGRTRSLDSAVYIPVVMQSMPMNLEVKTPARASLQGDLRDAMEAELCNDVKD